jgi:hypothetical protein
MLSSERNYPIQSKTAINLSGIGYFIYEYQGQLGGWPSGEFEFCYRYVSSVQYVHLQLHFFISEIPEAVCMYL